MIHVSLQLRFHVGQKTPRLRRSALKLEEHSPALYLVAMLQRLQAHRLLKTRRMPEKTHPPGLRSRSPDVGQTGTGENNKKFEC